MASSTSDGPLEELLAPVVEQSGLELDSVTRSRSDAMPLLRVIVEAPIGADGIDSDTLADVSRAVSKALDAADPIDGEYLLEVSTPGAERELTKVGHWMRQIGRLVRIKLRAPVDMFPDASLRLTRPAQRSMSTVKRLPLTIRT